MAGRLFVISACSGTGKTTLARELLREVKNLVSSISCTTRKPRSNEKDGQDYHFISTEEFLKLKKKKGFLEWAKVFDNFYGTPKDKINEHLKHDRDVLLVIDVQGAKQVKRMQPDGIFIFLVPPTKEELKARLIKRGTETDEEIEKRFSIAKKEMKQLNDLKLCDYRIVNKHIPVAVEVLKAIIRAEKQVEHV